MIGNTQQESTVYVIFIDDGSKYQYRAKNAKGKTATFKSETEAHDAAIALREGNRSIIRTTVVYEGKRK